MSFVHVLSMIILLTFVQVHMYCIYYTCKSQYLLLYVRFISTCMHIANRMCLLIQCLLVAFPGREKFRLQT